MLNMFKDEFSTDIFHNFSIIRSYIYMMLMARVW